MAVSKNTPTIIVLAGAVLREGIASLLQNTPYNIVGYAVGRADLPHITSPKGERMLAIVGWNRQSKNVEDTIRLLRSSMPDGKVVLLAETNEPTELESVLALSPDACIFNLGSRHTLLKVLELTFRNQRVFVFGESAARTARDSTALITNEKDNNVNATGSSPTGSHRRGTTYEAELSPRECDVLTCLAQGKSNKAIARIYNLSEATVKVHLKAILRKIKAHNRTQAAIWAIQHGVCDPSLGGNGAAVESQQTDGHRATHAGARQANGYDPESPFVRARYSSATNAESTKALVSIS